MTEARRWTRRLRRPPWAGATWLRCSWDRERQVPRRGWVRGARPECQGTVAYRCAGPDHRQPARLRRASVSHRGRLRAGTDIFRGLSWTRSPTPLTPPPGRPWPGGRSLAPIARFSTAAAADLYGDGQEELVVGGPRPQASPEARAIPTAAMSGCSTHRGRSVDDYDTNQEVVSSPAVGSFWRTGRRGSPWAPAPTTPAPPTLTR